MTVMRSLLAALAIAAMAGSARAAGADDATVTLASAEADATLVEPAPLPPAVIARIDLSDQTMTVYRDQEQVYTFKVSTARRGYITPVGRYQALWLSRYHRSRKYDNAPMPWAVFFHGGYAVHGTTDIRHLGRIASHGCVRLHPENAKIFFSMVKEVGMDRTLIAVVP